jgi:septation ring formation regulator EzrA
MSSQLKDLETRIERITESGKTHEIESLVSSLLQKIQTVVDELKEEDALVKQIYTLKKGAVVPKNASEDEVAEARKTMSLLTQAKRLEFKISEKRKLLGSIKSKLQALASSIR